MKRRDSLVQCKIDQIEEKRKELGVSKGELSTRAEMNADYWSHVTSDTGANNPGFGPLMRMESILADIEAEAKAAAQ